MFALRHSHLRALALLTTGASVACGSAPPAPPATPAAPVAAALQKDAIFDTSPVAEPAGLVLIGRVNKPDAMVGVAASWAKLPLPTGAELVRSMTDEGVAGVVDLSQPIDLALVVDLSPRGLSADVSTLAAFSVAVKSYEQAKAKLAEKHTFVAGRNGQLKLSGSSKKKSESRHHPVAPRGDEEESGDGEKTEEGDDGCVLAPAPAGGRLVCGEAAAVTALAPYLSRTMPRRNWTSDVHFEMRPEPVRMPLKALQAGGLGKGAITSLFGSGAAGALADSSLTEAVDLADDTQKIVFDAQVSESGIVADTRVEFQSAKSLVARAVTTRSGESSSASFWHLPGDADFAAFGRGSDPKLYEHPRELLGNLVLELSSSSGMPEPEQALLKDLLADRLFKLFTSGPGVYAKGYDDAALQKALTSLKAIDQGKLAARAEAKRAVAEQSLGWHLFQVSEPVAQVGPMLKDWSSLWNRPAFTKWLTSKGRASSKDGLPRFRIAPVPANVTLPKDTIHLEVTIPRDEIVDYSAQEHDSNRKTLDSSGGSPSAVPATKKPAAPSKATKPTKFTPKPYVLHLFAVPDGGKTWIGIGLDPKLVAQKAAAALASAPDTNTLGKTAGTETLREATVSSGGFLTLRGLLAVASIAGDDSASASATAGLPHHGATPIFFTGRVDAPTATTSAGTAVGTLRVPTAVIEDIVAFAFRNFGR